MLPKTTTEFMVLCADCKQPFLVPSTTLFDTTTRIQCYLCQRRTRLIDDIVKTIKQSNDPGVRDGRHLLSC